MPKAASKKAASKVVPKQSLEERKRKQYQEALEQREQARNRIEMTELRLRRFRNTISECQNRINVLEYLFSTLGESNPVIEDYLMKAIEAENEEVREINVDSQEDRECLKDHRKAYTAAEKTIASIIENGPDTQERFDLDDDVYPDGKSAAAGR